MPDRILKALQILTAVLAAAALIACFRIFPADLRGAVRELPAVFSSNWRFPVDTAMALLAMAVLWFAAAGLGHLLLGATGADETLPSFWARWTLAPLAGWAAISLSVFAAGLAGGMNRPVLGTMTALFAAAGLKGWRLLLADLSEAFAGGADSSGEASVPGPGVGFSGWISLVVLAFYVLAVPYAATPAVESDELRYHLAAPEAYLEAGRIFRIPHQAFSNFPFLVEMLFTLAMSLQGTQAAKLIHLGFLESAATLTAMLAYTTARLALDRPVPGVRFGARTHAAAAGLAFACVPAFFFTACWGFIDLGATAYFLAVIYLGSLLLSARRPPPAWLLGLMAGACMGTKYTMPPLLAAVLALMALAPRLPFARHPRRPPPGLRYLAAGALAAAATASPWYLRNLAWTGNPVFPMAGGVFGAPEDWDGPNARFYAAKAGEKGFPMERLAGELAERDLPASFLLGPARKPAELLVSPVTTAFFPEYFESHFLGPLPLTGMALAPLGLAGLLRRGGPRPGRARRALRNRHLAWMTALAAGTWLFWFLTYQSNRMLAIPAALILALSGWSAARLTLEEPAAPVARLLISATIPAGLVYALLHIAGALLAGPRFQRPLPVALGFERPEDYLARTVDYYAAARWLAPRLRSGDKALLIGEHRTLYFPGGAVASDWFDTPQPLSFLRETPDNGRMIEKLRSAGFRYILLNRGELAKYYRRYFVPRLTPAELARFEAFTGFPSGRPDSALKPVHKDPRRDIVIYELGESPGRRGP